MSVAAERAIVAHSLRSAEAHDRAAVVISAGDFTDQRSRLLFELVGKLRDGGHAVDEITIASRLGRSTRWAATGADDPSIYLRGLIAEAPAIAGLDDWIELVRSASVANTIHAYCQELTAIAYDTALTAEQKITEMHARLPVGDGLSSDQFVSYAEAAKDAVRLIVKRQSGEVSGLTSGMAHVDRMTGGWEPSTLTIIAGRPSHGKSIYAMDFAHAAASVGPVFIFSLEMSRANLAMRGIASLGRIDFGTLRSSKLADSEQDQVVGAVNRMKSMPIWIDDRGGLSVDQLRTRARIMSRREKPALIITDYLTLLSGVGENRTAQVGYVSRSLKAMAKELDVPVICLAQLNRGVDSRIDRRPTLSDLRDSGEIEQDADIVAFTYLHEKYEPETQRKGIGELIFAKQRNGETGSLFCEFQGKYQRFIEFTGVVPPEEPDDAFGDGDKPRSLANRARSRSDVGEPF